MLPTGSVFGIDADSWGVIVAIAAFLLALYSAVGSRRSSDRAERAARAAEHTADALAETANAAARSAGAAEQSATATTASTAAAERSAVAAETSARHAGESATAASRLAIAQERALTLAEQRAVQENRERANRDAPRWLPVSETERDWWTSDDNNLTGVLVNKGAVPAVVTRVILDLPNGGGLDGEFAREPQGHFGGGQTKLEVQPGLAIRITFKTTDGSLGAGMQGSVGPRVKIECSSPDLGWEGTPAVELLRRSGGVASATRWLPRPV